MKKIIGFIAVISCYMSAGAINPNRILTDDDWLFTEGTEAQTDFATLAKRPTVATASAETTETDPSKGWVKVSLPHDWSILHDFDESQPSGNDGGYLPTGKGIYRKTLNIGREAVGKPCDLYFEGVYMNSEVIVNGHRVGDHPYGYTSFRCDIAPYLKEGDNEIEVRVDNSRQKNSRWYTGSGIYRHVWLEPHGDIYIEPLSLRITTPRADEKSGIARIAFTILDPKAKDYKEALRLPLSVSIDGVNPVVRDTVTIGAGETKKYCFYEIPVAEPRLWSTTLPNLYSVRVDLSLPDGSTESETERFGFRRIEYSADQGFKLNGEPVKISGACVHHDNGLLGAASYDDAEIHKVRLLKDAGFNAVRTSHNPTSPAFLDACDSLGLMVIDEAFDGWKAPKNTHDYNELIDEWWDKDISSLVERDRNHPSVIAWSIGNEVIERKSPSAVEIARKLSDKCRELDGTRPVTQALAAWDPDWEIYDPLASNTEIVGYNYMIHKAEGDHRRVPSRVMWQTESYPRDAFRNWTKVNDLNYVIGDFVWTGIDYVGESGIGRYWYEGEPEGEHYHRPLWPWHNSYCGDIDITGERKPISYYRQMLFSPRPMMDISVREPQGYKGKIKEGLWAVYPSEHSWTWPGHEGKPIEIVVASTYPAVKLYQDGKVVGERKTDRTNEFKAVFTVEYKPGELKAVALDENGETIEEQSLVTAGKPYAIRLTTVSPGGGLGAQSLAYVTAEVVDKKGNRVPNAALPIVFETEGDGKILATGSGNPKDPKGYYHTERLSDKGRALAIVKYDGRQPGVLKVTAKSPKLKSASMKVR